MRFAAFHRIFAVVALAMNVPPRANFLPFRCLCRFNIRLGDNRKGRAGSIPDAAFIAVINIYLLKLIYSATLAPSLP